MSSRLCLAFIALFISTNSLVATDPFPYTWVEKKTDKWVHLHGYLGGAAIVLDDVPNKKKDRFWLKDLISPTNFQRYVKDSTAGPIWGENALAYFITVANQQYFCIRLAWGERIVFHLDGFKPVSASTLDDKLLLAQEVQTVRERLQQAVKLLDAGDKKLEAKWSETNNAISMVERLGLVELVPLVQRLEESTFGSVLPFFADNSSVHIRRAAQFTLRRLGLKPQGYPATSIPIKGNFQIKPFDKPFAERIQHVDAVKSGQLAGTVVETIGMPDYIHSVNYLDPNRISPTYWRYDMDADSPYSLIVILHKNVVHDVKRLEPPLWKEMDNIEKASSRQIFKADGEWEWSTDWETIEKHYLGYRIWKTSFILAGTLVLIAACLYLMRRRMNRPIDKGQIG